MRIRLRSRGAWILAPCLGLAAAWTQAGLEERDARDAAMDCTTSPPSAWVATQIPARRDSAMTGSAFAAHTTGWSGTNRQRAALDELRAGNIPEFLRTLRPVHLEHRTRDGNVLVATVWVTPDYLSIGSDRDFLRMPLTRPAAVRIAEELGFVLPTRKIVDAIYEQADFRFTPHPLPPGRMMRSSAYYVQHNEIIEKEYEGRSHGELVAGHKKDVVLTNRLLGTQRIAIYGWHRKNGKPIQGLSTVHDALYADYSHGIRLVHPSICVNGEQRSFYDVIADPKLAPLLTYEGVIARFRGLMTPTR